MKKFKIHSTEGIGRGWYYPTISKFPGGEIRVRGADMPYKEDVILYAILTNSDDVMTLVMLVDALRETGIKNITLSMPYVPYARQDRVCNRGEALSIRAFAKIINSLNFSSVIVLDPHSDVTPAIIDRCRIVPRASVMGIHKDVYAWIIKDDTSPMYLVSPDAGAVKKSYEITKEFPQFDGIIFADKVRDVKTGEIVRTTVHNVPFDIDEARLLVCDDICDGGRTFIELAKVLKPHKPKELNLYVTHGIFSQGKDLLGEYFDNIWCTVDFTEYNKGE